MSKQTGGPAFPCEEQGPDQATLTYSGLTIRDYFAAKALQGLINAHSTMYCHEGQYYSNDPCKEVEAKLAYGYADAMLAEREK